MITLKELTMCSPEIKLLGVTPPISMDPPKQVDLDASAG